MASPKVTAVGFEEASIVTPGAVPAYSQIKGVSEATTTFDSESLEIPGDDQILDIWRHSQKGNLTIKGAVLDLDVYEAITGNTVVEDAGPPAITSILGGTDTELYPVSIMLRLKQKARDMETKELYTRYLYLFSCVGTIKNNGMKYADKVEVEINLDLLRSTTEEYDEALSKPAMFREDLVEVVS